MTVDKPRFVVHQYIMNSPEPERETIEVGRYDSAEDAWIAGIFLSQLLARESGEFIADSLGAPNVAALEQTGPHSFRRVSPCDELRGMVTGMINAVRVAKAELDHWKAPPPF